MALIPNGIPEKTIERLSEYRRTLLACHREGITHIFSHVLAGIHGITAVQVRRDLMLIGFSSDTKKGYDVKVLIDFISNILDSESPVNIAVIGMGHLGQAITKYFNGKSLKLRMIAVFGISSGHYDPFASVFYERLEQVDRRGQKVEVAVVVKESGAQPGVMQQVFRPEFSHNFINFRFVKQVGFNVADAVCVCFVADGQSIDFKAVFLQKRNCFFTD